MDKLHDLRDYLLRRIPELQRSPERLLTFVERGRIIFHHGGNYSHRYQIPVRVVITDWRGSVDDVTLPLLEWLLVREPGADPDNAIGFEAEIIDKETSDIAFTLEISERVIVTFAEGERHIEHVLPDPPLQMNDGAEWTLFVDGPPGQNVIPGPNDDGE